VKSPGLNGAPHRIHSILIHGRPCFWHVVRDHFRSRSAKPTAFANLQLTAEADIKTLHASAPEKRKLYCSINAFGVYSLRFVPPFLRPSPSLPPYSLPTLASEHHRHRHATTGFSASAARSQRPWSPRRSPRCRRRKGTKGSPPTRTPPPPSPPPPCRLAPRRSKRPVTSLSSGIYFQDCCCNLTRCLPQQPVAPQVRAVGLVRLLRRGAPRRHPWHRGRASDKQIKINFQGASAPRPCRDPI
jgi:hypothetical protein